MEFIRNLITGPQALILLGSILTLSGALWSSNQDSSQKRIINEKNQLIIDKTEEIARLNTKTVNILTGGNSFPFITLSNGSAFISIKGENAIQNVFGRILNVRELREAQRTHGFINNYSGEQFEFNVVSSAYGHSIKTPWLNINVSGRYLVHIYTPYNTYIQWIAVEIDAKGLHQQAYEVYRANESEPILCYYPPEFPILENLIDYKEILAPEEFGPSK